MSRARAIARRLWRGLKPHLIRIGRWLLRVMSKRGLKRLISYMEMRVDVFDERRSRARAKWRKRWLSGRISRWNRAIAWLKRNGQPVTKRVVDELESSAKDERIPYYSRLEKARKAA